jgi:hypothetical protein
VTPRKTQDLKSWIAAMDDDGLAKLMEALAARGIVASRPQEWLSPFDPSARVRDPYPLR